MKKLLLLTVCILTVISFKYFISSDYKYDYKLTLNEKEYNLITFDNAASRTKGLSGIRPSDFSDEDLAIFVFDSFAPVYFWMPNTFFDLSIVFLDEDFLVIGKEELPHFPEKPTQENKSLIPKTSTYKAKYVIELKKGSPLNKFIDIGEYLNIIKK